MLRDMRLAGGMPSANALSPMGTMWLGDPIRYAPGTGVFAGSSLARSAAFLGFIYAHPPPSNANRWALVTQTGLIQSASKRRYEK